MSIVVPIERDREILARLADGHTMKRIAEAEGINKDAISARLGRCAGRVMVASSYSLLALAVAEGWIVRTPNGWTAPPDAANWLDDADGGDLS